MAKILVVDDSEKIRKFVQQILLGANHDILLAEDSFEAMEFLDKYYFDLMILDVNMPYKNGFTALKDLRKSNKFKCLPVIFITGRSEKRDVEQAASLDAAGYVLKPIEAKDFLEKVSSVLEATKPKKREFLLEEPSNLAQVQLSSVTQGQIIRVSEIGVDVFSMIDFPEGQKLRVNSPLLTHIGIDPPSMRVLSSAPEQQGYRIKLTFVDLNQESIELLKIWLQKDEQIFKVS